MSTEGNYIQSRLEKFENEKISLELQHKYYEYLSHYLESKDMNATIISPTVMGITDPVLLRLVNELSDIQKQIAEVGYSLNTQQGVYTLLTGQLDKIRQELKENVSNSLGSLNMSMTEIDKRIAEVEVELSNLPSTERQLINIERNFDLNNTVYTYLLEKRSESEIARASNVSDNRIIDRAARHSTTQIRPRKNKNIMLAWFFGLALPALCLVILDNLNDKILDKKDIERRTRVPLIGYIGHNDSDNQLPVVEKPGSSLSESFRSVRTAIKYYVDENKTAVITVTSTITSEGKSFVSANLSAITAALGKKVLLVGLDLRKPKLGKIFKSNLSGMSTFLSNNSEYEEIIQKTEVENLYFVPAGAIPPNPSELIEGERMKEFIERAKKEFDYIIFDTPPVGVVTDTLLIAPYVDVNLFIVRQRYSSRNTLDLIEYFRSSGQMKNMAIVLNDIKLRGYYGYGMRYGGYAVGYSYGYNYYGKGYYGKYGYNYKGGSGYYID
ncbi:MAG TPA: polysaccharide biosynthesis tyrosine autokinase [Bacteroidetes bacterium]|nr:polysaccharide biosynthesis tyrosine autokinase [Bacteroidota bacterium]